MKLTQNKIASIIVIILGIITLILSISKYGILYGIMHFVFLTIFGLLGIYLLHKIILKFPKE